MGKLVGGLIGALLIRSPLGAAFGVVFGHLFDEYSEAAAAASPEQLTSIGQLFFRATFRVMGYVAKADGRVSEQEISAARMVMAELGLTAPQVQEAIACFTAGKAAEFNLDGELHSLAENCRSRPGLARVFVEIQMRAALAGNDLAGPARPLLNHIARGLGVSGLELAQIETLLRIQRSGFRAGAARAGTARDGRLEDAYQVLGTTSAASDQEVIKAYRRQLNRHHPDKLKANGLPESMMAHAKQRTQQIIEAWELIRERRGLS